jgi:hypothetical protein
MSNFREPTKIVWDKTSVHRSRVDACRILGSREEISLLFGDEPAGDSERFQITRRIILNPFAAKQLSAALNRAISDYEARFGDLKIGEPRPAPDPEARRQKAVSVFHLVKTLGVSIGHEKSFKMSSQSLLADRFLLGINKKVIDCKAEDRIVDICRQMNMPASLFETFHKALFDADYVHFGFEDDGRSCIYKVYVEFLDHIQEQLNASPGEKVSSCLLHLGFKWDPFEEQRQAVTRYTWHPWITGGRIMDRVAAIADPIRHVDLFESAKTLVEMATARMPFQDILYLEVTEAGNPRKSFDINVYRGGMQVAEIYPLLARLGQYHAIAYRRFRELYAQIQNQRFGHLAGGIDRQGKDFCTVYYGAEPASDRESLQALSLGPGRGPSFRETCFVEQNDEQAALLMEMVHGFDVPIALERSFKVSPGLFLGDRFLVGFERFKVKPDPVFDICRRIQMPTDFLASFARDLEAANIVLFGFEKDGRKRVFKAYLEFNDRLHQALADNPDNPAPFEIFIGFKWDVDDPSRKIVTRYTCYPAIVLRDVADRAAGFIRRAGTMEAVTIINGILDLASHRAGPRDLLYFEAAEADTGRSSFSINLYPTGLRLAEVYPLLLDMANCYSVPKDALHRVYESAKHQFLGNIAGGIDRQGKEFSTFYYAEKGNTRQRAT